MVLTIDLDDVILYNQQQWNWKWSNRAKEDYFSESVTSLGVIDGLRYLAERYTLYAVTARRPIFADVTTASLKANFVHHLLAGTIHTRYGNFKWPEIKWLGAVGHIDDRADVLAKLPFVRRYRWDITTGKYMKVAGLQPHLTNIGYTYAGYEEGEVEDQTPRYTPPETFRNFCQRVHADVREKGIPEPRYDNPELWSEYTTEDPTRYIGPPESSKYHQLRRGFIPW